MKRQHEAQTTHSPAEEAQLVQAAYIVFAAGRESTPTPKHQPPHASEAVTLLSTRVQSANPETEAPAVAEPCSEGMEYASLER